MFIMLILLIGALLLWLAATNRVKTFLDAMKDPTKTSKPEA